MRMSPAIIALLLVMAPGCRDARPSSSPMAPSTTVSQSQFQQQSLAGFVTDTAFRTVAGATVEVLDGPQAGMTITTDDKGLFSYSGTFAGAVTLRVSKDGYIALTKSTQTSAPGGRPWVTFQLEAIAPPVNIAGDYTLTFIADSTCAGVPNELRTRTYAATIAPQSNPLTRHDTSFTLTAGGVPFLATYNHFPVGVAGDYVAFNVYNGEDFGLVEQVAPKTYLAVFGGAAASVETSAASLISVPFNGVIEYCVQKSETGAPYDCSGSPSVIYEQCRSNNHRLILTRR